MHLNNQRYSTSNAKEHVNRIMRRETKADLSTENEGCSEKWAWRGEGAPVGGVSCSEVENYEQEPGPPLLLSGLFL